MNLWILADVLLWVAVAAPYLVIGSGLFLTVLVARRAYRALVNASHRLAALLQEPVVDTAIGDGVPDGYEHADDLATIRRFASYIEDPPQHDTQPGTNQAALDTCTAIWDTKPARTEENQ
ncbi:hypothetical protein OG897_13330 [Streptomyces sp. NBC_00237]|uniref:hypothetical protein n=1 Tax=Streptomyces sp. NBC_00237 TaxID=2975687 RepID=UPI00224F181D|nr:hypothetical protein [Streptomyces sp. NBC_00237]MCX5202425.1 hypothetical protein [Streptomyces sp. NBC_00237]